MMSYLYESFNARNYTPKQVAETFIRNRDYEDLWRNEHTVVLGPRGSGKTTLFKMLTVQAIHSWDDPTAKKLQDERPFTAIYVPTDMHWHHQLKHAEEHLRLAPRFSDAASRAAVTTSILIAVAKTFQERIHFETAPNGDQERELCHALINNWLLPPTLPSLELVVLALKARISEIRRLINRVIFEKCDDDQVNGVPEYFYLDYFASLDLGCCWFDRVYGMRQSAKWALCLDELELAPPWFQRLAFSQQRSTEDNYLIKLSTSPIPGTLGTTEARPKQDVRLICIWNHSGRDAEEFSDQLTRSILCRRLNARVDPGEIFGKSESVLQSEGNAVEKYSRGSPEWEMFRSLASWDPGVKQLLARSGLDPDDPFTEDVSIRDSVLRKAKPIALLRHTFLKQTASGRVALRSRKLAPIYCGREAIYRVSDGNPRRLIGILGDMAARIRRTERGALLPLSQNEQAEVLERASKHFFGYVHALPGGTVTIAGSTFDLATVLREIATFFRRRLLGPDFPLDPVGSFVVDAHLNERLIELLRLAVYHGAIVHVDPLPDTIETSPRGKRFRLSYMLAPLNRLPLTLYAPTSLSGILKASARLRVRRVLPGIVEQQQLTFETNVPQ